MHVWAVAQCLLRRGHKVCVVTHSYGDRQGIRYMTNGLKVYYCPLVSMVDQDSLPTFWAFFPLFRHIVLRERVTIVHGHQATSTLTNECILYARALGLKAVYTDHSLFGFNDMASIHINKVLQFTLSDIDHAISVSHTCRENLVLRANLHPETVSTIPNAVDATRFTPDPTRRSPKHKVNVVVVSRLVYRKGTDLLARVIPKACAACPDVHFIVGGDGPKKLLLEEMRERHQLHDRVELLGGVPHVQVRDVLVRGHIFLNCSLTESFCIAILEAASCGLFVVSTRVGGVTEVLPPHMTRFATPEVDALVDALLDAVPAVDRVVPSEFHDQVKQLYSWSDVTGRVEQVYDYVTQLPSPSLLTRFHKYRTVGPVAGWLCCLVVAAQWLFLQVLEWWDPAAAIEPAPRFPRHAFFPNTSATKDSDSETDGESPWADCEDRQADSQE